MGTRSRPSSRKTASSSCSSSLLFRLAFGLGFALVTGCTYTPPPEVDLDVPPEGTFFVGDTVHLSFDRPIRSRSLRVRLWPDDRDGENELRSSAVPLIDRCSPGRSPCGPLGIEMDAGDQGATLTFQPETIGKPDVPMLLEVRAGLTGKNGADTGTASWFDLQFKPLESTPPEDAIDFDNGVYVIVGETRQPLPTVLTLITDVKVLPDGHVALAGAEGDELGGAPKNTMDPTKLKIDDTEMGYTVFANGRVRLSEDGERFLETEPVEVNVGLGNILIRIRRMRLTSKVVKDDQGKDRLEGTLSFEAITLDSGNGNPFDFPAGSTTFKASFVPVEQVPEGTPRLCDDLCGAVTNHCEPPEGWPGESFCPPNE